MYLPLDTQDFTEPNTNPWSEQKLSASEEVAQQLKLLFDQTSNPALSDNLLLESLVTAAAKISNSQASTQGSDRVKQSNETNYLDFGQSENDFINAYNALTRLSPLPNVNSLKVVNNDIPRGNRLPTEQYESLPMQNLNTPNEPQNMPPNISLPIKHEVIANPMEQKLSETTVLPEAAALPDATELKVQVDQKRSVNTKVVSKQKQQYRGHTTSSNDRTQNNNQRPQAFTAQNKTKSNKSSNNFSDLPPMIVDDDKSNNLNDIVDNTQKLIQQMKDEINSDINSLDDRNTSDNSIDSENSSHDEDFSSEHESTYSDSEGHTEGVFSDDSKSSSQEDDEKNENTPTTSQKSSIPVNRTSSEENEQFEEALDHIEEQIEDFKKSNFEVLDSIARSLQEEHVMSVEVNPPNASNKRRQDFNNNFTAVKSFEEIYEELNVEPSNSRSATASPQKSAVKTESFDEADTPEESNSSVQLFTKHEVFIVHFNLESPTQLEITDNKPLALNAIISSSQHENHVESENRTHEAETTQMEETEDHSDKNEEQTEESGSECSEPGSPNMPELVQSDKSPSPEVQNITQIIDAIAATIELANNKESVAQQVSNEIQLESYNNDDMPIDRGEPFIPSVDMNKTEEENSTSKDTKSNVKNNASVKSNIPKPIRIFQTQKQKVEKTISKIIGSKVPVRRNSIKQHPAPPPPKSTFGTVSNGTVKQLQTRLFNKPKVTVNLSPLKSAAAGAQAEPKPSTSTMSKKKQAPLPPVRVEEQKRNSATPPSSSPPKSQEKPKSFFRETCRTEDEWTESDSDDSQTNPRPAQIVEPERAPPTPPPPITVRRVSGQIIDLATVRLPEGSPEVRLSRILDTHSFDHDRQNLLMNQFTIRNTSARLHTGVFPLF